MSKTNIIIKSGLHDILSQRTITQKELSKRTGIRASTISEIVRGTKTVINFKHLELIASVLNIQDINELITLKKVDKKVVNRKAHTTHKQLD